MMAQVFFSRHQVAKELRSFDSESKTISDCSNRCFQSKSPLTVCFQSTTTKFTTTIRRQLNNPQASLARFIRNKAVKGVFWELRLKETLILSIKKSHLKVKLYSNSVKALRLKKSSDLLRIKAQNMLVG